MITRTLSFFKTFFVDLWRNRKLIIRLSINDFKTRYAGSMMGIFWAFVQPVITVLIYWFVFEKGLRAGAQAMGGVAVPFVLFLISGLVPWFFFSDAWPNGTSSLISYSYLVKKVVFKIEILPMVKAVSALYVHTFFVLLTYLLYCVYGKFPGLYTLQIFYYSLCMFLMVLSLSYATSAITVLFRDMEQLIAIVLQIGVWATPIMWDLGSIGLPKWLVFLFKMNPMYYIVYGYRDTFIFHKGFWEHPLLTLYFWLFTAAAYLWGVKTFRRSRGHFADVL